MPNSWVSSLYFNKMAVYRFVILQHCQAVFCRSGRFHILTHRFLFMDPSLHFGNGPGESGYIATRGREVSRTFFTD